MSSVQEVSWLTIEAFDNVVASFITKHKHQEKVLISHEIYNDAVKVHKGQNDIRDANFRFWAKSKFALSSGPGEPDILCKREGSDRQIGKPVAIKENLYSYIVDGHTRCDHGARDPTFKKVIFNIIYYIFANVI
ncbi:hypothetical protein INT45_012958 [Circinella minor]|uniref:Uncharacterized protein n=1 Tax=Circinella minor TaxID=1195481 RepID=A0A8H7RH01_9FUNG|nr:hypothetical protein INT45_012958 [Circinella minor]